MGGWGGERADREGTEEERKEEKESICKMPVEEQKKIAELETRSLLN